MSVLSSGKINKWDYFTGEEILPSNQSQIIEQGEFILPSRKIFEKTNRETS